MDAEEEDEDAEGCEEEEDAGDQSGELNSSEAPEGEMQIDNSTEMEEDEDKENSSITDWGTPSHGDALQRMKSLRLFVRDKVVKDATLIVHGRGKIWLFIIWVLGKQERVLKCS